MQTQYSTNINIATHIRFIAALAFVPTNDVFRWYIALKGFAFFKNKLSSKSDNGIKKLLKYVEQTWIGSNDREGNYRSGRFSIGIWDMYDMVLNGLPRTNNTTEGWHNSIRTFFGAHHPQIFKLIQGIKTKQGLQEVVMAQLQPGIHRKRG